MNYIKYICCIEILKILYIYIWKIMFLPLILESNCDFAIVFTTL